MHIWVNIYGLWTRKNPPIMNAHKDIENGLGSNLKKKCVSAIFHAKKPESFCINSRHISLFMQSQMPAEKGCKINSVGPLPTFSGMVQRSAFLTDIYLWRGHKSNENTHLRCKVQPSSPVSNFPDLSKATNSSAPLDEYGQLPCDHYHALQSVSPQHRLHATLNALKHELHTTIYAMVLNAKAVFNLSWTHQSCVKRTNKPNACNCNPHRHAARWGRKEHNCHKDPISKKKNSRIIFGSTGSFVWNSEVGAKILQGLLTREVRIAPLPWLRAIAGAYSTIPSQENCNYRRLEMKMTLTNSLQ